MRKNHELADDEALCSTIYGLAFLTDKTALTNHLKLARRTFNLKTRNNAKHYEMHKTSLKTNDFFVRARTHITDSTPDYNTDDDS